MSRHHKVKMEPSPEVPTTTRNPEPNRATESSEVGGRIKIKSEENLQSVNVETTEMSDHSSNNLNTADASQSVENGKDTVNVGIIGKWEQLRAKFWEQLREQMESQIVKIPSPAEGSVETTLRRVEDGLHQILVTIGCLYSSIIKIMDDHLNEACQNINDYNIIINRNDDLLQAIYNKYKNIFTSNESTLRTDVSDFIHKITDTISEISRMEAQPNVQTTSYDQSSQFCTRLNQKIKEHNGYLEYFRTFVNNTKYGILSDAKLSTRGMKKRNSTTTHADDQYIDKLIEMFAKEVKATIDAIISEYNDADKTDGTTDRLETPTTSRAEYQNSEAAAKQRHSQMEKTYQSLISIKMKIEFKSDLTNNEYTILNEELDDIYCCEFRDIFTNEDMEILNRYIEVRSLLDWKQPQSHGKKILNTTNDGTQAETSGISGTSTEHSPPMKKRRCSAKSSWDDLALSDDPEPSVSSVKTVRTYSSDDEPIVIND